MRFQHPPARRNFSSRRYERIFYHRKTFLLSFSKGGGKHLFWVRLFRERCEKFRIIEMRRGMSHPMNVSANSTTQRCCFHVCCASARIDKQLNIDSRGAVAMSCNSPSSLSELIFTTTLSPNFRAKDLPFQSDKEISKGTCWVKRKDIPSLFQMISRDDFIR